MNKKKIISIIVVSLVLIGLIIFASTYKLSDSHLRAEGVRVRVNEGALLVSECDEGNAIYCKKTLEVNKEEQELYFEFLNFKENGYPDAVRATINGKEFYYEEGLNIEENGSIDYKIFLNFHVIDDIIVFTFTDGTNSGSTTLYAMDTDGNYVLEEYEIDDDNMIIKDYTEFITYEDNTITIYATRVEGDVNYHGESICNAPHDAIVEGYYTYTYEDGEFTKEMVDEIDTDEFIENREIICANRSEE